ncbi:hypothetical protein [Kribbella sp. VKM Ac-2571]|uniref:hypothetical protein n=1 Tax=Kribbella sp. VKM Ac-2571 TaxID=2512222 RepID=UPI001EDED322|nr:hypothetical protein [Kribbella sp. VKM Ac-2571]
MPEDTSAAVVSEFEAESWPLEAAADSLHQVIDGFQNGDTRPLVIGDGDQPVLVVLAIADLADFRSRIADLLGNPVDAGWLRYYLRSNFDMSSERLVELLGVDTDHGLSSLASQVNVEQAATLMPDHVRRTEAGGNPLMLIGDGTMATAALLSFQAFQVLLAMEGDGKGEDDSCAHDDEEKPTTPLEVLAERIGPVSTQLVAQINAGREPGLPRYELHFEDELVEHLRDLEARAQKAPGGGAYDELNGLLHQFDPDAQRAGRSGSRGAGRGAVPRSIRSEGGAAGHPGRVPRRRRRPVPGRPGRTAARGADLVRPVRGAAEGLGRAGRDRRGAGPPAARAALGERPAAAAV